MLLKQFVKYQSLGNDFILFDWFKKPATFVKNELPGHAFSEIARGLCDRHFGVGADGVLVITADQLASLPEIVVYNADGSNGEVCLNGLRFVAHYLHTHHHFPDTFSILLGGRIIDCVVVKNGQQDVDVVTRVGIVEVLGQKKITTTAGEFDGFVASVGNPHFIVFDRVEPEWLATHGKLLESHAAFPKKTNVEFVWEMGKELLGPVRRSFFMQVYERGCGITLACSSGAAALAGLLVSRGMVLVGEKVNVVMPGGTVVAWVDEQGMVTLQASAKRVFVGSLED